MSKKEKAYCYKCGASCSGRIQVQLRKNADPKPFCGVCFNRAILYKDYPLKQKKINDLNKIGGKTNGKNS